MTGTRKGISLCSCYTSWMCVTANIVIPLYVLLTSRVQLSSGMFLSHINLSNGSKCYYEYPESAGLCYVLNPKQLDTWPNAYYSCIENGGQLLMKPTATRTAVVHEIMRQQNISEAWLGITRVLIPWTWMATRSNAPPLSSLWAVNQPTGADSQEDCVILDVTRDYKMATYPCSERAGYVCEADETSSLCQHAAVYVTEIIYHNGSCYLFVDGSRDQKNNVTWFEVAHACAELSYAFDGRSVDRKSVARAANIVSLELYNKVERASPGRSHDISRYWIGLTRATWISSSGLIIDHFFVDGLKAIRCVTMVTSGGIVPVYKSYPCQQTLNYICQFDLTRFRDPTESASEIVTKATYTATSASQQTIAATGTARKAATVETATPEALAVTAATRTTTKTATPEALAVTTTTTTTRTKTATPEAPALTTITPSRTTNTTMTPANTTMTPTNRTTTSTNTTMTSTNRTTTSTNTTMTSTNTTMTPTNTTMTPTSRRTTAITTATSAAAAAAATTTTTTTTNRTTTSTNTNMKTTNTTTAAANTTTATRTTKAATLMAPGTLSTTKTTTTTTISTTKTRNIGTATPMASSTTTPKTNTTTTRMKTATSPVTTNTALPPGVKATPISSSFARNSLKTKPDDSTTAPLANYTDIIFEEDNDHRTEEALLTNHVSTPPDVNNTSKRPPVTSGKRCENLFPISLRVYVTAAIRDVSDARTINVMLQNVTRRVTATSGDVCLSVSVIRIADLLNDFDVTNTGRAGDGTGDKVSEVKIDVVITYCDYDGLRRYDVMRDIDVSYSILVCLSDVTAVEEAKTRPILDRFDVIIPASDVKALDDVITEVTNRVLNHLSSPATPSGGTETTNWVRDDANLISTTNNFIILVATFPCLVVLLILVVVVVLVVRRKRAIHGSSAAPYLDLGNSYEKICRESVSSQSSDDNQSGHFYYDNQPTTATNQITSHSAAPEQTFVTLADDEQRAREQKSAPEERERSKNCPKLVHEPRKSVHFARNTRLSMESGQSGDRRRQQTVNLDRHSAIKRSKNGVVKINAPKHGATIYSDNTPNTLFYNCWTVPSSGKT